MGRFNTSFQGFKIFLKNFISTQNFNLFNSPIPQASYVVHVSTLEYCLISNDELHSLDFTQGDFINIHRRNFHIYLDLKCLKQSN